MRKLLFGALLATATFLLTAVTALADEWPPNLPHP
jgi:hypothetical protein